MKPLVIILGTIGSGRANLVRELIAHAWPEGHKVRVIREAHESSDHTNQWHFQNGQANLPNPGEEDVAILVTHGSQHIIDQMEAIHRTVRPCKANATWNIARILTVVDCSLAAKYPMIEEWYKSCIHFSDVVIINRKWEVTGQWLSKFLNSYIHEFYPCLFINLTKSGQIPNPAAVIEGEPLRLSHIFDDIDAVDEIEFDEDNLPDEPFDLVRQVDKYFQRDEQGRRSILTPEIADLLRQEGRI